MVVYLALVSGHMLLGSGKHMKYTSLSDELRLTLICRYGAKLVADDLQNGCSGDCITGGTILAVFFSVIFGSMAMGQIAPPLTAFTSARAAAVPLFEVINRKPLIDGLSNEGNIPDKEIKGKIELDNIEFSYPSRPHIQVSRGYSLTIEPGETVALVGPSGCGKSTIINLLLRFYDPQGGSVQLDGIDIKTLNTRWLRSQMG
jgi:ATP-binding cassette subfamily B (MDR/TAP) protein 1